MATNSTNNEYKKARIRLYTEIAAVLMVVIASLGNISITTDLASDPQARPDPFTGSDFDRFHRHEFEPLQERLDECEQWQENHTAWGRQRAGRNDALFRNLEESVQDLQSQVLYLYQQHEQD